MATNSTYITPLGNAPFTLNRVVAVVAVIYYYYCGSSSGSSTNAGNQLHLDFYFVASGSPASPAPAPSASVFSPTIRFFCALAPVAALASETDEQIKQLGQHARIEQFEELGQQKDHDLTVGRDERHTSAAAASCLRECHDHVEAELEKVLPQSMETREQLKMLVEAFLRLGVDKEQHLKEPATRAEDDGDDESRHEHAVRVVLELQVAFFFTQNVGPNVCYDIKELDNEEFPIFRLALAVLVVAGRQAQGNAEETCENDGTKKR